MYSRFWFIAVYILFQISQTLQNERLYRYIEQRDLVTHECDRVLNDFAESSSNFTHCIVKNSHPIHVCEFCKDNYLEVLNSHNEILNSKINNTVCKEKLINLDRLEIVESTFQYIQDIWKRGYCDSSHISECFVWINGTIILSNETEIFMRYHKDAMNCILNHTQIDNNTDVICQDCMKKYLKLNSFYESLKSTSETTGICMDIVDSMNSTRFIWSEELDCCKLRRTPEIIFLCCSAIIAILPALFYIFARFYCQNTSQPTIINRNQLVESLNDFSPASTSIDR